MTEKLTDDDRAEIRADEYEGQTITPKMLRVIDAQAAALDQANARVAELEALYQRCAFQCDAANARADAAELAERETERTLSNRCRLLESEAAALRARIASALALCRDKNLRSTRDPNAVSIVSVRFALLGAES